MTSKKLIAQGAEAKIILSLSSSEGREGTQKQFITKDRIKKSYRIPELDEKIRKRRTKAETKLLTKASKLINVPIPIISSEPRVGERFRGRDKSSKVITRARSRVGRKLQNTKISMPFIEGKKLSEHLDSFTLEKQKKICKTMGEEIAKLHDENIIHGDLTTSNMILANPSGGQGGNKPTIYFIDFGLGYFNGKYEDKAVDLHLLKQALEAKHFKHWEILWKNVERGYKKFSPRGGGRENQKKVLNRLIAVEKRGRYKH